MAPSIRESSSFSGQQDREPNTVIRGESEYRPVAGLPACFRVEVGNPRAVGFRGHGNGKPIDFPRCADGVGEGGSVRAWFSSRSE